MPENKGLAFFLASAKRGDGDQAEDEKEAADLGKQYREDAKVPDEMVVAATEILEALGQDYANGPTASESSRREFHAKARRLASSLAAFFQMCEAMPEGGE